jgi:2-deoxy-D-gluconate 3-dehydrogenase
MTRQTIAQLFDLSGKSAVVTGGAMGIGRSIAYRLAEAGASVMIADIDQDAASETAQKVVARVSGKAQAVRADASNPADAEKVVQATVEAFGGLDILVNNAGIYPTSSMFDTTEQLWDKVLGINLKGAFFYSQAAARQMIKAGRGGRIINMASIDALHPHVELAHYGSSKAGVIMLTKDLALELAPHQILVNAIAPGTIMTRGIGGEATARSAAGKSTQELMDEFMRRLPLGRPGTPDDIAKAALFLASGAADYVTGAVLTVDGGYLLS